MTKISYCLINWITTFTSTYNNNFQYQISTFYRAIPQQWTNLTMESVEIIHSVTCEVCLQRIPLSLHCEYGHVLCPVCFRRVPICPVCRTGSSISPFQATLQLHKYAEKPVMKTKHSRPDPAIYDLYMKNVREAVRCEEKRRKSFRGRVIAVVRRVRSMSWKLCGRPKAEKIWFQGVSTSWVCYNYK